MDIHNKTQSGQLILPEPVPNSSEGHHSLPVGPALG